MPPFERITITSINPPSAADINAELQWLGAALGLFGERDKDASCFRVFVTLVQASRGSNLLSSDEIADSCMLSRGTVVHHINRLRDAGLVRHDNNRYQLTGESLSQSLRKIQDEVNKMMKISEKIAEDIDRKLGL